MKKRLEAIIPDDLETACGGANTQEWKGNLGIDVKGAKIGLQGEGKSSTSDYGSCLKTMAGAGATPTAIAATCGKPGASK